MNPKWYSQRRLLLLKTAIVWLHGSRLKATWSLQADVLFRIRQTGGSIANKQARLFMHAFSLSLSLFTQVIISSISSVQLKL